MKTENWHFENGSFAVHIEGEGPPLLLIHGIGPGTSFHANFGAVVPALAAHRTLYGIDLIGFGASPRKTAPPLFDFPLWVRQAEAALRRIGGDRVDVWGQSMGAAVALSAAAASPVVRKVVGTGAGGGMRTVNPVLERFWTTPTSAEAMRAAMTGAVYDAASLTDAQVSARFELLSQEGRGAYFAAMMAAGREAALQSGWLAPPLLGRVEADVLLVHGRDDRPVPYRDSALHLLDHLPRARLMLLGRCGHNPMLERTDEVTALALDHLLN
ncbi:alpha/beta hydrolase [Xylophilus sp. GOD-11R]|uniref:alpha/beta fold hydrolase n=1 Tax=Xylophilus sp. GOD-11R TaxID=3089814 RepID=UPI00298C7DBA|nr:alpha/beta hydrolase [Xylophilus sp. GOD-11R]WPB57625.1 alpha/beta hydrolase [Xylophilus sp. GOD-11R]